MLCHPVLCRAVLQVRRSTYHEVLKLAEAQPLLQIKGERCPGKDAVCCVLACTVHTHVPACSTCGLRLCSAHKVALLLAFQLRHRLSDKRSRVQIGCRTLTWAMGNQREASAHRMHLTCMRITRHSSCWTRHCRVITTHTDLTQSLTCSLVAFVACACRCAAVRDQWCQGSVPAQQTPATRPQVHSSARQVRPWQHSVLCADDCLPVLSMDCAERVVHVLHALSVACCRLAQVDMQS